MEKVAEFFKVSEKEFLNSGKSADVLSGVLLPRRATKGSAGYDFFVPVTFTLAPRETVKIATGVRVKIKNGWVLMIFPAENEGHIFIKMTNCGDKILTVEKGKAFAQGVFLPFGITESDACETTRVGGFGSTDKSF